MVARLWYGLSVPLCVFDLDHTLIQTPLDLAAMALDMRALIEQANGPMPTRPERYRVGELIAHCQSSARAALRARTSAEVRALALELQHTFGHGLAVTE